MYLSNILKASSVVKEAVKMVNEREFDFFARPNAALNGKKCIFLLDKKDAKSINDSVSMAITTKDVFSELDKTNCGFCLTENPRDLYFELMNEYELARDYPKIPTIKGENCSVGKYVSIADYNVKIGNNVIIEDFVQICPNVTIGDDTIIRAGAKIGVQAFYIYDYAGKSKQLFHNGRVIVGKNVLIGQNCVIEQALYHYGITKIEDDCKFGANVVIGHNACIGKGCEATAGATVAGHVIVGEYSTLRLGTLIAHAVTIGERAHIGMGSVVMRDVTANSRTLGNPARELRELGED